MEATTPRVRKPVQEIGKYHMVVASIGRIDQEASDGHKLTIEEQRSALNDRISATLRFIGGQLSMNKHVCFLGMNLSRKFVEARKMISSLLPGQALGVKRGKLMVDAYFINCEDLTLDQMNEFLLTEYPIYERPEIANEGSSAQTLVNALNSKFK